MILRRIHLHPFGGITDLILCFEPGLNVVLGENESGKSTIFQAIQQVLFTKVHLKKREFERSIVPFLPIGGGDTLCVGLDFTVGESKYHLNRSWGGTKSERLVLPDKTFLTDEKNLCDRLSSILPATEGTFKSVLMTYQAGLAKTLAGIKEDTKIKEDLGGLLRKAIFETDGVSVDLFRKSVQEKHESHFKRWDQERDRPEDESKVFRNGVGDLLQKWYAMEDARKRCEEAHEYDAEMDALNAEIASMDTGITNKKAFITAQKPIVESIHQRQLFQSRLETVQSRMGKYEADNKGWPVVEQRLKEVKKELPDLKKSVSLKEVQLEKRRLLDKQIEKRNRFEDLKDLKEASEVAEAALERVPTLKDEELTELQELDNLKNWLEAKISAAALSLKVVARKPLGISIQEGILDPDKHNFGSGETFERVYKGKIRISHPDWDVELTSGDGSLEESIEEFQQTQKTLSERLVDFDLEDMETARQANSDYSAKAKEAAFAKSKFEEALSEDLYENLEAEITQVEGESDLPSEAVIVGELAGLQQDLKEKKSVKCEAKQRIEELTAEYGGERELFKKVSKVIGQESELETQILELTPLPEGVDDPDSLQRQYKESESELKTVEDQRIERLFARKDLEKKEPEKTSEELNALLVEAEATYEKAWRRGAAIEQVHIETEGLAKKLDTDTYAGLVRDLSCTVSAMTGGRYSKLPVKDGLPAGLKRADGKDLEYDLLSAGTKDVLALALRLAMAKQFLAEAAGVLILDDPLVDMDPNRQEMAVSALRGFSEEKQVILFTCHPGHAKLLRGNQIELT